MTELRARIAIVTGGALRGNPRVLKEAQTLARRGYEVSVFTNSPRTAEDLALAVCGDFELCSAVSDIDATASLPTLPNLCRIQGRIAREAHRYAGLESRWLIGPRLSNLLRRSQEKKPQCYIAHLESGVWVGQRLLQKGLSVGVDMEDWFSEDLFPEARRNRPLHLLRRLEDDLLNKSVFASCPSQAMSRALANEYGCRPPAVIYNAFPWTERAALDGASKDRADHQGPSIHWFSQTIGAGRGLEDLFAALPHLTHEAEIHLRGKPILGFGAWLADRVPDAWRDRVILHGTVPNQELLSRIAEHDIGFAGEIKYCRSRDLTVTNKMLQYLLGGLAIVASDTEGQREVAVHAPGAVLLYPSGDPAALAARLNDLLGSPDRLNRAKAAALVAARNKFCWERQETVVLDAVETAITAQTC